MSKAKTGDLVTLKSGSPSLTITKEKVDKPKHVEVTWFEGTQLKTAELPVAALNTQAEDKPEGDTAAAAPKQAE